MFKWVKIIGVMIVGFGACAIAGGCISRTTGEIITNILESDS